MINLVMANFIITILNIFLCASLNEEVIVVYKIFLGLDLVPCVAVLAVGFSIPVYFLAGRVAMMVIASTLLKYYILPVNIFFCLFLFYLAIVNASALHAFLFISPFFDIVKEVWTIEQRETVFSIIAIEKFPNYCFTILEKTEIIKDSYHPAVMEQKMRDCINEHNRWGISKTLYNVGSWVITLNPLNVLFVVVGISIPSYFLIAKFLGLGIISFSVMTKATVENPEDVRNFFTNSTCCLEFIINAINLYFNQQSMVGSAAPNTGVRNSMLNAKKTVKAIWTWLQIYDKKSTE